MQHEKNEMKEEIQPTESIQAGQSQTWTHDEEKKVVRK